LLWRTPIFAAKDDTSSSMGLPYQFANDVWGFLPELR
jgi:hypothetical protein